MAASLNRRGFAYVVALTLSISFAGAAGMVDRDDHDADIRALASHRRGH